jgi:hypothetical protein
LGYGVVVLANGDFINPDAAIDMYQPLLMIKAFNIDAILA